MSKFRFEKCSQKGSHVYSEIAKETLNSILEQADIELEEFMRNL